MIPIKKYVDITTQYKSSPTDKRSYHCRVYTQNHLLPVDTFVRCFSTSEVQEYFGATSSEAQLAKIHFSYVSPSGEVPSFMEFTKYSPQGAYPFIRGTVVGNSQLSSLQGISDGDLKVVLGGTVKEMTNLDFSQSKSWAEIVTVLNTALTPQVGTFSYAESLTLTSADVGSINILEVSSTTDGLINALGLNDLTLSYGKGTQTVEQCLDASLEIGGVPTDNFGSFILLDATAEEVLSCSMWNNTKQNQYLYSCRVYNDSFLDLDQHTAILQTEGTVMTFDNTEQGCEVMPCAILSATDYSKDNAVMGYMYRQFPGAIGIIKGNEYIDLDDARINYYGSTSSTGTMYSFYQNGLISGQARYIEVYCAGMVLKSKAEQLLIQTLINQSIIVAGPAGANLIEGLLKSIASEMIKCGAFTQKELSEAVKVDLIQSYGSDAVTSLEDNTYYVKVSVVGDTIQYIYLFNSVVGVRKIEGQHIVVGA